MMTSDELGQATRSRANGSQLPHIYETIRDRICLLQYPPGALLKEGQLAVEFGVSRTPIRHVLQRLEFEGLVISKHGSGTYVTTVDLKFLKEVYAFRLKLTELIGELSAAALPAEDLLLLEDLRQQCKQLREQRERDYEGLGRLYMTFNHVLTRTINNKPLRQISEQLFYQTSRVWLSILPDLNWTEEVDYVYDEITDVLAGLRAGDTQQVSQTRRNHMVMLLRRIGSYLGGPAVV